MARDLSYYLSLPYSIKLYPAQEGGFVSEIPDLPGCLSQGQTAAEAITMIEDAKKSWLSIALEQDMEIPLPAEFRSSENYSGKFNVRIPKTLHRSLANRARAEGVSLNQLIVYELSKMIGRPRNLSQRHIGDHAESIVRIETERTGK